MWMAWGGKIRSGGRFEHIRIGAAEIILRDHLPLPDFPPITIGALWHGKITPITKAFLDDLERRAKALGG